MKMSWILNNIFYYTLRKFNKETPYVKTLVKRKKIFLQNNKKNPQQYLQIKTLTKQSRRSVISKSHEKNISHKNKTSHIVTKKLFQLKFKIRTRNLYNPRTRCIKHRLMDTCARH